MMFLINFAVVLMVALLVILALDLYWRGKGDV